jgi:hypothetical protein
MFFINAIFQKKKKVVIFTRRCQQTSYNCQSQIHLLISLTIQLPAKLEKQLREHASNQRMTFDHNNVTMAANSRRALRAAVRKRANYCCEYCKSQDQISSSPFSIEHIIPLGILLDIFHATAQSSPRLAPIDVDNRFVASLAALRETKMSSSVSFGEKWC